MLNRGFRTVSHVSVLGTDSIQYPTPETLSSTLNDCWPDSRNSGTVPHSPLPVWAEYCTETVLWVERERERERQTTEAAYTYRQIDCLHNEWHCCAAKRWDSLLYRRLHLKRLLISSSVVLLQSIWSLVFLSSFFFFFSPVSYFLRLHLCICWRDMSSVLIYKYINKNR